MTIVRTGSLICITISALNLFLPLTLKAGDPPAPAPKPAAPTAPAAIPDSTPSGKRDPYCPQLLAVLRKKLAKEMDNSIAKKVEARPAASTQLIEHAQEVRNAILKRVKVHVYSSNPIEILDSGIGLKATYVARVKTKGVADDLGDQYEKEIDAVIRAAETYPDRWNDLLDVEMQAKDRLNELKKVIASIKENRLQQKQWIKALGAESDKLNRLPLNHSVEIEIPVFDAEGKLQVTSQQHKFNNVTEARKTISELQAKLSQDVKADKTYWIQLGVIRDHDVVAVPHSDPFKIDDIESTIKKFESLISDLDGGYKKEGSYLNMAAGQVINLRSAQLIRRVLRTQRQNLQTDLKAVPDYINDQIARIDKLLDPMDEPVAAFSPPAIAFQKVKTGQLKKQFSWFRSTVKDDINKPIRTRKQWDDLSGGVLDSTSNPHGNEPPLKIGTDDAPPDSQSPNGPHAPDSSTPTFPGWANNTNSGLSTGQGTWLEPNIGTAGQFDTSTTGSIFTRYFSRSSPLTDRYDKLLSKISSIDPTIVQAYGGRKLALTLALWRGTKIVGWSGAITTLASPFVTPKQAWDAILSMRELSDSAQIKLCAAQGAKQVGDQLIVPSDPAENAQSEQAFIDCSIAFVKTKFVKDYLDILSTDNSIVTADKKADFVEIDPEKIATKRTKGNFFKDKVTGEIYLRPTITSVSLANQPGVVFDPKLKLFKINIQQIPVAKPNKQEAIIEKDPNSGHLIIHIDRVAATGSGLYFLNNNNELELAPKVQELAEQLKVARRKNTGFQNRLSNIESILRQEFSSSDPCSDPYYTRWMTSKSNEEFKSGFLKCIRFRYPIFMELGKTDEGVSAIADADSKKQPDMLAPYLKLNAGFGNFICSLLSQRLMTVDPVNGPMTAMTLFNCQNLGSVGIPGGFGGGMPGGAGGGVPGGAGGGMGNWGWGSNPGGGWSPGGGTNGTPGTGTGTGGAGTGTTPTQPQGNTSPGAPNNIPNFLGPPGPNANVSKFFEDK